jgi:hypothetical protein
MSSENTRSAWVGSPPTWALPVSVPVNITLVRSLDLVAQVTAAVVFPQGFLFYLVMGFDLRSYPFQLLDFHSPREQRDYPTPARLQVRFPDGSVADSSVKTHYRPAPEGPVMVYQGGDPHPGEPTNPGDDACRRHESGWWVSPLPPSGVLEFVMQTRDSLEPTGSGTFDAGPILVAASRSSACHSTWESS